MPRPLVRFAVVAATGITVAALTAVLPASAAPAPQAITVAGPAPSPPAVVHTAVVPAAVVHTAVPAPAAAVRASALAGALGKIGAPYRWGAAGPRSFDCSGLVHWAYQQAGTTLPRSSRAMASVGTPVARAQLQPGDLVFFYRPVSHVAIYIGHGQVVHASTSGTPVKIADMSTMPFTAARRI